MDSLDTESNPPEPNGFEKCDEVKAPVGLVDSVSAADSYMLWDCALSFQTRKIWFEY